MTLALLGPSGLDKAAVVAWQQLADRAAEPNPYFEPGFVLPALEHLGGDGVSLAVVHDGDRWRAAMPVQHRVRRVGAGARLGRLAGPCAVAWCHTHCFLGTPLLDAGDPDRAARDLVAGLAGRGDAAWLGFPLVGRDGPVESALRDAFAAAGLTTRPYEAFERATLRRRPDNDYIMTTLKPKRHREVQRLGRALEREAGPLAVRDRAGDAEAVDRFLALEHGGWKGDETTSLAADPGHAAFFRAMCDAFAAQRRLQLLELRAGDRVVAMKCNLIAQDALFCFKIAYDESVGRASPGIQLEVRNVDAFHAVPELRWMDSCAAPDNEMINRLWPDRRRIATALVPTRTMRGRLARMALPMAVRIREQMERRHVRAS